MTFASEKKNQINTVFFSTSLNFPELFDSQEGCCCCRVTTSVRSLKVLWVQVALAADNVTGASPTLAPVQIGVTCRCPNGSVVSRDSPAVTLNYCAEWLQQDGVTQQWEAGVLGLYQRTGKEEALWVPIGFWGELGELLYYFFLNSMLMIFIWPQFQVSRPRKMMS